MTSVEKVIYSRRPNVLQTLSRYFQMSGLSADVLVLLGSSKAFSGKLWWRTYRRRI